jgi:cell division protein FtsB
VSSQPGGPVRSGGLPRPGGWPPPPPSLQDLSRKLSETGSFLRGRRGRGPGWKVWLVSALFLWAGYTILAGPQGLLRLMDVRANERELTREIAFWGAKLDSLKDLDSRIPIDPHLREKVAREDFGMVHKNELVYFTKPPAAVRMGPGMWGEDETEGDPESPGENPPPIAGD